MIAIVDYGMGNVRSIRNALHWLGHEASVTADHEVIRDAERLILPGVGAFGEAMESIRSLGLDELLLRELEAGKPLLGVCLGMQLLARQSSEHGEHKGLGWFDAEVHPLIVPAPLKVPHVGWNEITFAPDERLFAELKGASRDFYFVHGFHMVCRNTGDVIATCEYGATITAAVRRRSVVATQFHPEKSQDNGLRVLENFLLWNP
jgi:glutamine amidotransferase